MTDRIKTDALRDQRWQNLDELVEWVTAAADEIDRLRDVIDDAPHAPECYSGGAPATECDCWKADAP